MFMDAKKHTRETIAKQLKAFRKAAGISAKDAAEAIEKKENTVYAWESGQNQPDAETFLALCNLYHADISEFFGTEPTSYSTETQLSADEAELLELWRKATPVGRESALMVLKCNESPVKKESAM